MDALFAAVRRACPTPLWNLGTSLARDGKVILVSQDHEEVLCQVMGAKGAAVATRVYPEDAEWDCDCPSTAPVCEHVAAATIALRLAAQGGAELPTAADQGKVIYRFSPCAPTISLQRIIEHEGQATPVKGSLRAFAKQSSLPFVMTEADRRADAVLDPPSSKALPPNQLKALFSILAEAPTYLEQASIRLKTKEVLPKASLRDHPKGDGFVLVIRPNPAVDEVVGAGLVRCGQDLCFLGELNLCGIHMERLPLAKHFAPKAVPTLLAKTLPALKKRFPVEIRTDKLPDQTRSLVPKTRFCIQRRDDTLEIRPEIVYGDPPVAKVVQKRLERIQGPLPKRDEAKEVALLMALRDKFSMIPEQTVYLHGDLALRFIDQLSSFDGLVQGYDPRIRAKLALLPRIEVDKGQLQLRFSALGSEGDASRVDVSTAAVLQAWQQGQSQVMLPNAQAARLDLGWFQEHGPQLLRMSQGAQKGKANLKQVDPVQALALAQMLQGLNAPPVPELAALSSVLANFEKIPQAPLPQTFTATLRPYQRQGVNWLSFMRSIGMGALLADDMGLGKTIQTLASLPPGSLVVCPTSVIFNWKSEAQRFIPGMRVNLFHGPKRDLCPEAELTITSYALMRQDPRIAEHHWPCVVLDEAQAIKNPQSQTSQAAFALKADARIALSGTPVENRLDELWSLMHFCNPGLLGGRNEFQAQIAVPISQGNQEVAQRLQRKIMPVLLRREKSQVAKELPPRTEDVLYCELDTQERAVYDQVRVQTQKALAPSLEAGEPAHFSMLEQLLRLRQAACHRGLLPGQDAASSSKIERLRMTLETLVAAGHRALVFSQWTSMLDAIDAQLTKHKISWSRIDGSTRDRGALVQDFAKPDGPSVMLISLKAGGTGLNLTAADHVFLMDPWWNPAAEAQAADRAHRIGQDKPVMVYRMVAKDTVEEKILALQAKKRAIAQQAMSGAMTQAQLTRSELQALLDH